MDCYYLSTLTDKFDTNVPLFFKDLPRSELAGVLSSFLTSAISIFCDFQYNYYNYISTSINHLNQN